MDRDIRTRRYRGLTGWAALAWAVLAAGCGGGATQKAFLTAATVPAAVATVRVSEGDSGNTRLRLRAEHLAPPQNVSPGARVYVVWAKPTAPNAQPQNIGIMVVGDNREGRLE